jgi:hypothetical protein
MLINLAHLPYYDYITNSTVTMHIDSSNYPLTDGDPGALSLAIDAFTNIPAK